MKRCFFGFPYNYRTTFQHYERKIVEYTQVKQPNSIELYCKKMKGMSTQTLSGYHRRWEWLLRHYSKSEVVTKSENIILAVNGTIAKVKAGELKITTYRQYKAALCYGLALNFIALDDDEYNESDADLTQYMLSDLYKSLINVNAPSDAPNSTNKTSSQKLKNFPQDFYNYLFALYNNGDNNYGNSFNALCAFIDANLLVGLRPIEWINCSLACNTTTRQFVMFVENAKNSMGRANGDVRELILDGISPIQTNKIILYFLIFHSQLEDRVKRLHKKQVEFEKTSEYRIEKERNLLSKVHDNYSPLYLNSEPAANYYNHYLVPQRLIGESYYHVMQNELYRLYNLFLIEANTNSDDEYRVALYSTRHQCIANAKKSNLNKFVIAAFFGHASSETNKKHYGKAWKGWSTFTFKPSVESILHVEGGLEYLNSLSDEAIAKQIPNNPNRNPVLKISNQYNLNISKP